MGQKRVMMSGLVYHGWLQLAIRWSLWVDQEQPNGLLISALFHHPVLVCSISTPSCAENIHPIATLACAFVGFHPCWMCIHSTIIPVIIIWLYTEYGMFIIVMWCWVVCTDLRSLVSLSSNAPVGGLHLGGQKGICLLKTGWPPELCLVYCYL